MKLPNTNLETHPRGDDGNPNSIINGNWVILDNMVQGVPHNARIAWDNVLKKFKAVKDETSATQAPTASDDITQGYSIGSLWYDTVGEKLYTCINNVEGGAIWL